MTRPLHTYVVVYRGRKQTIKAPDLWTAKNTAISLLGLTRKQSHLMAIVLAETADGEKVNTIPQIS